MLKVSVGEAKNRLPYFLHLVEEKNEEIQKKEIVKAEDTGLSTKQYAILGSIIILSGSLILKKKLNN